MAKLKELDERMSRLEMGRGALAETISARDDAGMRAEDHWRERALRAEAERDKAMMENRELRAENRVLRGQRGADAAAIREVLDRYQ